MTIPVLAVGVNAVILDERRRLLLTRRVDNGRWWVPLGSLYGRGEADRPVAG